VKRTWERAWLKAAICLVLPWASLWTWAADEPADANQVAARSIDFGVFWPPKDPSTNPAPGTRPLLSGKLTLQAEHPSDGALATHLRVVLTRPSDEVARLFWNSQLAFAEYDWMRYLRVWDSGNQWLWPNLAYLLRLHGVERIQRYGGMDPGKGVDNDFAAVLIRKYDVSGHNESEETKDGPLVAAEWYPVEAGVVNRESIVHAVQSGEFTLHLGRSGEVEGLAVVWLIYADFMGAKLPDSWPKAPEYAGGILACFEVRWNLKRAVGEEISVRQVVPKQGTSFDWERWTPRTLAARDPKSTAKLSDVPQGRTDNSKVAPSSESGGGAGR
jgi:hypothetical protein